ncbi:glycoside hydrolase family 65 protein [Rhodococcus sp. D2-41]|uniref:Family 65 glycosyl hydrolase n=1 Tax=Speluncibacter jeojiensis TaxID=2710754 RepID=A0A9X4M098_9ACTN|nr:glycosyl hydrolase family 65 protein [Rhodococcus sp. D2-41]MDG3010927.1 glycoside hydrolase family 65 protein [Rhodococcus sp. D2-41]MDG3013902.1 family 65 glycosyl hydrolase [Corynebacteriales bacterium D3-21]
MIRHPAFTVEPWCVRATRFDLDVLSQVESVFALSNGHIGWRANLDEGEPNGLPGSYLNGVWEQRPLPYAEAGYGYPEAGQTVINVTNGKLIRLLVNDEPFDVRYGTLHEHEMVLDLRAGLLRRTVEWTSPAGRRVRVESVRLVSLTQRAVAAICYDVQVLDGPARVVVQSELVSNEQLPEVAGDPRAASAVPDPLRPEAHGSHQLWAQLVHRTSGSGLRVGCAMDHVVEGSNVQSVAESHPDLGRVTLTAELKPGQRLRVVKFVAYGWSGVRSLPGIRAQVDAALASARQTGWDGLVAEQREALNRFWDRADVELDGDSEIQQAVRFALFHVLQAGARAEGQAIPAKGLTGPGYNGHTFWDSETFVQPVLTYTSPRATAFALRWRHSTLPLAKERAAQLGLRGAAFPWRTIHGEECSSYWPAGTAAFHVSADIADAVIRYARATGDTDFEQSVGLELLVETARLWRSLGHHDAEGRFRIDGVTGPDEYSAVADNNIYTNLMAQQNLRAAAVWGHRYPGKARDLGVDEEELAQWHDAADAMFIPYDEELGVHPQAEGFTEHKEWDFSVCTDDDYPLFLHFPYFDLYRKQVTKQADLVLAMFLRGDAFTAEEKSRNFDYYERITVRDSSLSACVQAVLAAEVGHLSLAHDYLGEAALMDLDDLEHNTRDGLHIASLAGTWIALVYGLGGLRHYHDEGPVAFSPLLPEGITRLAFNVFLRKQRLRVSVVHDGATYTLESGDPVRLLHHGTEVVVTERAPVTMPLPRTEPRPAPTQPRGRVPEHRGTGSAGAPTRR